MEPLISVIIPCYNAARFLRESIESALTQSYSNIEVIVVNDGSTDNSADIAGEYHGVCCIHQANAGVATARNTGLLHSSGEYIVFLDADDRLTPNALESSARCLADEADCAFAFGDVQAIGADGSALPHRSICPHEGKEHYLTLLYHCYIWTPGAVMYRRSVLDVVGGFDRRVAAAADLELNLRITRTYPACHNRAIVLEYRMYPGNMNSNFALMLRATVTVLRWQRKWLEDDAEHMEALKHGVRFFQNYYGNLLMTQIVQNVLGGHRWRETSAGLLVLLRYAPQVPVKRSLRFAGRLASRQWPRRAHQA